MATLEFAGGLSQLLLGFVFMNVGGLKFGLTKADLMEQGAAWMDDIPEFGLRMLGSLEVMAGVAVLLPLAFDLPRSLVATGAAFMVVVMAGALVAHLRRGEWGRMLLNVALAGMAAFVVFSPPGG